MKAGDVVTLIRDTSLEECVERKHSYKKGVLMTVESVLAEGGAVICIWFEDKDLRRACFVSDLLEVMVIVRRTIEYVGTPEAVSRQMERSFADGIHCPGKVRITVKTTRTDIDRPEGIRLDDNRPWMFLDPVETEEPGIHTDVGGEG